MLIRKLNLWGGGVEEKQGNIGFEFGARKEKQMTAGCTVTVF